MPKKTKKLRATRLKVIDGVSESLWKSVAIKSLRMGWPAGIEAAHARLSGTVFADMIVGTVYEDVFPTLEGWG